MRQSFLFALLISLWLPLAAAANTTITYQGQLQENGEPFTGTPGMEFRLFDSLTDGNQIGETEIFSAIPVEDGLFEVELDFGASAFDGSKRWLEIEVAGNILEPRQRITPAPMAVQALNVPEEIVTGLTGGDGIAPATIGDGDTLSVAWEDAAELDATGSVTANFVEGLAGGDGIDPATIGDGDTLSLDTGFTDGLYWRQGGNAGTDPATDFLGTTDAVPFEIHVAGKRTLRLEPADVSNVIGGWTGNTIATDIIGATISGGGCPDLGTFPCDSEQLNEVTADFGAIGGGVGNTVLVPGGTVGGGQTNSASGYFATVGGGDGNTASGALFPTVGGGKGNTAGDDGSTVGGGEGNTARDFHATVGGGRGNTAGGSATVGGGDRNTANGSSATVGGGQSNLADARFATIAGGGPTDLFDEANTRNVIHDEYGAIGGGGNNQAGSDDGDPTTASFATVGGGRNNTASGFHATVGGGDNNTASGFIATVGGGFSNTADGDYSFAAGRRADTNGQAGAFVWADSTTNNVQADAADQVVFQAGGGMKVYTDSDTSTNTGAELPAGSGSWTGLSSRSAKTALEPVAPRAVLAAVAGLDLATWRYRAEDGDVRHMGPMAEDFFEAFGLGHDPRRIANVDADGVALAAIQGLHDELQSTREEMEALAERNAALEDRLARLESVLLDDRQVAGEQQ